MFQAKLEIADQWDTLVPVWGPHCKCRQRWPQTQANAESRGMNRNRISRSKDVKLARSRGWLCLQSAVMLSWTVLQVLWDPGWQERWEGTWWIAASPPRRNWTFIVLIWMALCTVLRTFLQMFLPGHPWLWPHLPPGHLDGWYLLWAITVNGQHQGPVTKFDCNINGSYDTNIRGVMQTKFVGRHHSTPTHKIKNAQMQILMFLKFCVDLTYIWVLQTQLVLLSNVS